MKKLNQLLAAATILTLNLTLNAAQAGQSTSVRATKTNTALLASPRYLETHPELLRGRASGAESLATKNERLAALTKNVALAGSPRFREAHPELRWSILPADQLPMRNLSASERYRELTANRALAASPRFREAHPELLHEQPEFEIAPLK